MISFTAQQGFLAGKSTIEYFKHNDLAQLEAKLIEYEQKEQKRVIFLLHGFIYFTIISFYCLE